MKDMNDDSNSKTATVLKSLADDTRLSIVRKLASDGCEVKSSDIINSCAEFHKLSQPAMSHHFSKLVSAGVLIERKAGVEKRYELNVQLLNDIGIDASNL
jgi:DNA-binding transcriptional ArsR family regulator